jgi:hypothetical protein
MRFVRTDPCSYQSIGDKLETLRRVIDAMPFDPRGLDRHGTSRA